MVKQDSSSNSDEENIVINHASTNSNQASEILKAFNSKIISQKSSEIDELKLDIIPATNISKLFPKLKYQDLLHPPVDENFNFSSPSFDSNKSPNQSPTKLDQTISRRSPVSSSLSPYSPRKFNKAVIGFRSPVKQYEPAENHELSKGISQNLIEIFDSDEDSQSSHDLSNIYEFYNHRIWFNANKMVKVREVSTQTTQFYDDVQIASNNVYSNTYPAPNSPVPRKPNVSDNCDAFLDGLNLLEDATILREITSEANNVPWNILNDDFEMFPKNVDNDSGDSSDSADVLSYVTKNIERKGIFGEDEVINKILMLDRAASRQSGAASCNSSIPQLDGVDDSELVKIGQLDGSTDDEQIVVVDDVEEVDNAARRLQAATEMLKPPTAAAASVDSFSSCGSLPSLSLIHI